MSALDILLYSTCDTRHLIYKDTDGMMTNEIELTMLHKCSVKHYMAGGARITVCQKTRDALQALEDKYDTCTGRHIRKLKGFISKLADGDCFYYFNKDKTSIVERRTAIDCLNAVKRGLPWSEMLHNRIFHHYSMMNICFSYLSYGYDDIAVRVGEEDETKRVCRFCGKRAPEVSFKKIAHAIQEALGNKLLICNEECDTCNHELALTEDNFRYLMDFRRAMYHIPRKGSSKTPTVVGKNFIIKSDSQGNPLLYIMKESLPDAAAEKQPFMMHLELKSPINNERMYKALCKMVIDMLPREELSHFKNTIEWIKSPGDWVPDALPSTLLAVLPAQCYQAQPVLDIFLNNRKERMNAPYCTAVVWLCDVAYMFILPLADVDGGRYKYDANLDTHWKSMADLIGIHRWSLQDTSNYLLSTPWVNWPIDLSLPNIHVLPKNDAVFKACLEVKPTYPDIGLPEFKKEGIHLDHVVSASFTQIYHGTITDDDLIDVTLLFKRLAFIFHPNRQKVSIIMDVNAKDTTDSIPFYRFNYEIDFRIDTFEDYIKIDYDQDGNPVSFACHYKLAHYLLGLSLVVAEDEMYPQRKGTPFEKCSLDKTFCNDRYLTNLDYFVLSKDGSKYLQLKGKDIHKPVYED